MKKLTALFIAGLLICTLASCSSGNDEAETETEDTAEEVVADTSEDTAAEVEEEVVIEDPTMAEGEDAVVVEDGVEFTTVHAEDYKYENGVLVIYTAEDDLIYKADSTVSVGMVASGAADSMSGTIVTADYPDLSSEDSAYKGVAIKTKYELEAGNWTFNITFDDYIVKFDMTIN